MYQWAIQEAFLFNVVEFSCYSGYNIRMSEQNNLEDLPGFRKGLRVARIDNVARRPVEGGTFGPLMEDVRANYLVSCLGNDVTIYLKAVPSPYTGEHGVHFLAIPDARDQSNIPGVKDLPPKDLRNTLQFAEAFAYQTLQQKGIDEVDFGFHHSRAEFSGIPKQRIASFPNNLHIHITGYSGQDMKPLPRGEVVRDSELRGKQEKHFMLLENNCLCMRSYHHYRMTILHSMSYLKK